MRQWTGIIMALMLAGTDIQCPADIAVIVSKHSDLGPLTRAQVLDIYTGRLLTLPNNEIPMPMDLRGSPTLRTEFYRLLTGKPLSQINTYWAQLLFSGQATPPRILPDTQAMLQAVRQNSSALGFIDTQNVPHDIKVLFLLTPSSP